MSENKMSWQSKSKISVAAACCVLRAARIV